MYENEILAGDFVVLEFQYFYYIHNDDDVNHTLEVHEKFSAPGFIDNSSAAPNFTLNRTDVVRTLIIESGTVKNEIHTRQVAIYPCGTSGLPSCPGYQFDVMYSKPRSCPPLNGRCEGSGDYKDPEFLNIGDATTAPSSMPSSIPSSSPSDDPSSSPSKMPSSLPSTSPSVKPSSSPSSLPSSDPSSEPSSSPSVLPSDEPSLLPSSDPSQAPSSHPSKEPSQTPSSSPSSDPSSEPSQTPSSSPSDNPTPGTPNPTKDPSSSPSLLPSRQPSDMPSLSPSAGPSLFPSSSPSMQPTICGYKENTNGEMISCGRYESNFTSLQSANNCSL